MLTVFAGLGLGLSLIVAIGAQNAFVLRQGIRGEHVLAVVLVCAVSDAVLIVAGVAGLGHIIESVPWLIAVARWGGFFYLLGYGVLSALRAWRGGNGMDAADRPGEEGTVQRRTAGSFSAVITTTVLLTWLNPHVYIDTVLMLGSIAATHGDERWLFAGGAVAASLIWFTALGFGAARLSGILHTEKAWRTIDALIALIMCAIAVSLVSPVLFV